MEHPEILPLIVFVVGILLSSLKKKPKMSGTGSKYNEVPGSADVPQIPEVAKCDDASEPYQDEYDDETLKPKVPELPIIPDEKEHKPIVIETDDAYAEPHPDVPVGADWRRAIIAHEILKRKF